MKLYQYVKILYVQPNCSMLPSVLGLCVRPPTCRTVARTSAARAVAAQLLRQDPSDCVLCSSLGL